MGFVLSLLLTHPHPDAQTLMLRLEFEVVTFKREALVQGVNDDTERTTCTCRCFKSQLKQQSQLWASVLIRMTDLAACVEHRLTES